MANAVRQFPLPMVTVTHGVALASHLGSLESSEHMEWDRTPTFHCFAEWFQPMYPEHFRLPKYSLLKNCLYIFKTQAGVPFLWPTGHALCRSPSGTGKTAAAAVLDTASEWTH